MANIVFSMASGVNDSIYGKSQAPIKLFIEKRGEAFEAASALDSLFCMQKSNHYGEKIASMTGMSGFQPVGENGAYPTDGMQESYSKFLESVTWKDSFAISQEMIEDANLMDLKKQPQAFTTGYYRTREKFGAALYGAAISGATSVQFGGKRFDVTCADEKPLFSTQHPSIVSSKLKQSNKFTNPFSADALGMLEAKMQHFTDDNGEILDVSPDTILIPNDHALKKAVFEAVGADKDPNTANNGFNYQFGRWNIICWSYLDQYITAAGSPWILLDSAYNKDYAGAVWLDRKELTVRSDLDNNTDANVWRGRARFVAGFNDWRYAAIGGAADGDTLA